MDLKVLDDVPQFDGTETDRERIERLADYLFRLAEMLRYTLQLLNDKAERGRTSEAGKTEISG